jgi:3-oxoacyl-[acyl-carrier protein] reductase
MSVALITGAGIGLGRATAISLARAGYKVAVTDILEAEGRAVAMEIGDAARFYPLDVTQTAQTNDVVAQAEADLGPLTALVLNAGIARKHPLLEMTDAQWDAVLDVDLKGMMRVLRAAAPGMRARKSGAVVCLSSIAGHVVGWNEHIAYSAAKGGVAGFVRASAIELAADGVRVNGIAPGVIRSAQTLDPVNSVGEDGLSAFAPSVPLGRVGAPEDIADVAMFLLSDQARYMTGQILVVDGGVTAAL